MRVPQNVQRLSLLILIAAIAASALFVRSRKSSAPKTTNSDAFTNALRLLELNETEAAQKYFAPELIAEKHAALFERLWDALNATTNKFDILSAFEIPTLIYAKPSPPREIAHAIQIREPSTQKISLPNDAFRQKLAQKKSEGWRLVQCEFRHTAFAPDKKPFAESTFYFSAHLENPAASERAILEGDLQVQWENADAPAIHQIGASHLQIRSRQGPVPFNLVLDREVSPPPGSFFIDPLIVRDLDGDGRPEVILAARNEVYRRSPNGEWNASPLCDDDPRLIFTAVIADFDGDGIDDFLTARFEGLFLHKGAPGGKFPTPARRVWEAQPHLKFAQVITCGDIDGDGDLDVFVGQYKVPLFKGNVPTPYFDANDGNPSYLLLNDGKGNFTDGTEQSGLGAKRHRRVYSSSFIDLDGDHDLDLITVSDFAGLDAFENDGHGHFREATSKWFAETHAFGMAHCFGDFNNDGQLDILMIGMNSPTADRLQSMNLARPYDVPDAGMRSKVTHGNRLYFGGADGIFRESGLSDQIARTGWSWGCAASDLDGDGFPDVYIANGHESRESVRDYETEFWMRDIFAGTSKENILAHTYFETKYARTRGRGWSYGGYEKNRLFLNDGGVGFTEVGFLFGVALEADSRNVVAADLNGDGKPDLIVTTFEVHPRIRQTIKIFENHLDQKSPAKPAPPKVKVTGDSYRSQSN
jgi:hypothetical protein